MSSNVTLLIGHRGVGKTTMLRQIAPIHREVMCLDLDQEMEMAHKLKIRDIFEKGEGYFRDFEQRVLNEIIGQAEGPTIIACGAGIEHLPPGPNVVWLRRSTDAMGRSFLNRPRLNDKVSPFREYMERFPSREKRFKSLCHEELWLPEGYESGMEDFLLSVQNWSLPYELTLLPENFRNFQAFWNKRASWNLRHIELRDDLLSPQQIEEAMAMLPDNKIIYSRRGQSDVWHDNVKMDWPRELGLPPKPPYIMSIHQRRESLNETLAEMSGAECHIQKVAVEIRTFSELERGHQWWLESPRDRAFLPRSKDGRWRWYRSLFGRAMPVHYFREGDGSGLDQPMLWQTLYQPAVSGHFAAVLGSPIEQSRSPVEHLQFFALSKTPIVAIPIEEARWEEAWPILGKLGLAFAAVTSPLKHKAGALVAMPAANTLWKTKGKWKGANTDVMALKVLAEDIEEYQTIWLWGGGGIRPSVQEAFPNVKMIKARSGSSDPNSPDLVMWAVPRSREFKWPDDTVTPKMVLDLNYTDDSPGLEWAASHNLRYTSGLRMFKLQAEFQREIWSTVLKEYLK